MKFLISECRLTWFLPPHPPTGSVATRRCASHYCLSRSANRCASVGLTSRPHHAHGALPAYVDRFACDWHRFSTTDPIRGYQKHYKTLICKIAMYFFCSEIEKTARNRRFSASFMRWFVLIILRARSADVFRARLGENQRGFADLSLFGVHRNDDGMQMHANQRAADVHAERGFAGRRPPPSRGRECGCKPRLQRRRPRAARGAPKPPADRSAPCRRGWCRLRG